MEVRRVGHGLGGRGRKASQPSSKPEAREGTEKVGGITGTPGRSGDAPCS